MCRRKSNKKQKSDGLEHLRDEESLSDLGLFSPENTEREESDRGFKYLEGGCQEEGSFFSGVL